MDIGTFSNITCPAGFSFVNKLQKQNPKANFFEKKKKSTSLIIYQKSDWQPHVVCKYAVSSLRQDCIPCPSGTYSLETASLFQETEFLCFPCPFGGDCSLGGSFIRARKNFWGIQTLVSASDSIIPAGSLEELSCDPVPETIRKGGEVIFYHCPEGYCCQTAICDTFHTCSGNRHGVLCGECKAGYTEALGTTQCRKKTECGTTAWDAAFYPLIIVFVFLLAYWFIYQPPVFSLIWAFSLW